MPRRLKQLHVKVWNEGFKAFVKETQVTIVADSFFALRKKLRAYLNQRNLDLGDATDVTHRCVCDAIEREKKGVLTHCTPEHEPVHPDTEARRKAEADTRGPRNLKRGNSGTDAFAWKQLHLAAKDGLLDDKFLKGFLARVTCGTCKSHSQSWVSKNPLRVGDEFAWTVDFHNFAQRALKRPTISPEEAWQIWS